MEEGLVRNLNRGRVQILELDGDKPTDPEADEEGQL